jgi:predicted nucleic acid-binding protein
VTEVVIDACCIINPAAANAFTTWLPRLGLEWKVPQAVVGEALFLRVLNDEGEPDQEAIDLEPFIASGLLEVVAPTGEAEIAAYVAYARDLDDGEAMALSLAASRGWVLATDDRHARSIAEADEV